MKAIELNPTPEGLAELSAYLNSGDPYFSQHAAYHFVKLGERATSQIPEMIRALDSSNENVRSNICAALAVIGSKASTALPKLKEIAATDPSSLVRGNATSALSSISARQAGGCQVEYLSEGETVNIIQNSIEDIFAAATTRLLVYGNKGCSYTEDFLQVLRQKKIEHEFRHVWGNPQNGADLNVIISAGGKKGYWTYPAVVHKGKIFFSPKPQDIGIIMKAR